MPRKRLATAVTATVQTTVPTTICSFCGETFKGKNRNTHLTRHHTICSIRKRAQGNHEVHQEAAKCDKGICYKCGFESKSTRSLVSHMVTGCKGETVTAQTPTQAYNDLVSTVCELRTTVVGLTKRLVAVEAENPQLLMMVDLSACMNDTMLAHCKFMLEKGFLNLKNFKFKGDSDKAIKLSAALDVVKSSLEEKIKAEDKSKKLTVEEFPSDYIESLMDMIKAGSIRLDEYVYCNKKEKMRILKIYMKRVDEDAAHTEIPDTDEYWSLTADRHIAALNIPDDEVVPCEATGSGTKKIQVADLPNDYQEYIVPMLERKVIDLDDYIYIDEQGKQAEIDKVKEKVKVYTIAENDAS